MSDPVANSAENQQQSNNSIENKENVSHLQDQQNHQNGSISHVFGAIVDPEISTIHYGGTGSGGGPAPSEQSDANKAPYAMPQHPPAPSAKHDQTDGSGSKTSSDHQKPATPEKNDENKPPPPENTTDPVLIHHIRPHQDPLFDEENDGYKMRMYAVETGKEEQGGQQSKQQQQQENPAGRVIDESTVHPTGKISNAGRQVSDEFVKVDKHDEKDEHEEEEEEEGEEVIIPSLNKRSLQILKREESDDYSQPNRKLDSTEEQVYKNVEPFLNGYVSGYLNERRTKNGDKYPIKNNIQLNAPENDSIADEGRKLAQVSSKLEASSSYKKSVQQFVDKFFDQLKTLAGNGGSSTKNNSDNNSIVQDVKVLLKNYKQIVEEIFREGYTWSRVLILFMFTFGVFERLCINYANVEQAKNFLSRLGSIFVNVGLTAWLIAQGGWKAVVDGVSTENAKELLTANLDFGNKCSKCIFAQHLKPTAQVLGAVAGAVLAAGAAYYVFQQKR